MAKNTSTYVPTTVAYKPSPVRPVTAIKPMKPFAWKTPPLPKPPKPNPATLVCMVKIHKQPCYRPSQDQCQALGRLAHRLAVCGSQAVHKASRKK